MWALSSVSTHAHQSNRRWLLEHHSIAQAVRVVVSALAIVVHVGLEHVVGLAVVVLQGRELLNGLCTAV